MGFIKIVLIFKKFLNRMQIRRMFGAMFRLKTESFSNKKMSKLQVSAFVVIL